ncbi:hypothetical protein [Pseudodesulfovibrio portus]|uniref:Uncharacterized protein n=1 Tax=Pseudodesulfovibrio portus TaxID=231439 RepID=A0ABN6RRU5_9BACT|nr:hypothetical protein [Pseudodesulfovibrio portus]BDQ33329.1 hypothetical protein JCM14722_08710 [Pseudodesulfovibrio portus]
MLRMSAVLSLVLCLPLAAFAGEAVNIDTLAGQWSYGQTVSNDVYVDAVELVPGEKGLGGVMTYMDGEETRQDVFSNFAVDKWGRITFVTTRPNGRVAKHSGELCNNGNTVRGNYNLGFGVGGRFVLDRFVDGAPPSMCGRWEYGIIKPGDGKAVTGDALLLGDSSGLFEGYLHYRTIDTSPKKIEGRVADDGTLLFEIYEKKTYVHQGRLDETGTAVEGTWADSGPGKGRFTMRKFTE